MDEEIIWQGCRSQYFVFHARLSQCGLGHKGHWPIENAYHFSLQVTGSFWYGDGLSNTTEESSGIFSLIQLS